HLDCGNGLLLLIRKHIDPLAPGELLEIVSQEPSVREDLPAWSRLTGNELVSVMATGDRTSYLVSKGPFSPPSVHAHDPANAMAAERQSRASMPLTQDVVTVTIPEKLPPPAPAPAIPPLAVMGIGSWPRPRWLL